MVTTAAAIDATRSTAPPTRWLRRWLRRAGWLLTAMALYALLVGWTATVRGPAAPAQPVTVLLIADQLHRGLLLPTDDGAFVEYGFGDWDWYALGHEQWSNVLSTVLLPTPGALARRRIAAGDAAAVRARMPWAQFQDLVVDAARATTLRRRLDAQFAAGGAARVERPGLGMEFVPWARTYWILDNCTDAVADWLGELDCTVGWLPLRFDLRVDAH